MITQGIIIFWLFSIVLKGVGNPPDYFPYDVIIFCFMIIFIPLMCIETYILEKYRNKINNIKIKKVE